MKTESTSSRSGFTVIELLVVITILMVLAALIFVVTGRARDAAHGSVCMNNMRQIASDNIALCNENNGVIIHAWTSTVRGGWRRNWMYHHTVLRNEDLTWKEPLNVLEDRVMTMDHLQCPMALRMNHEGMAKQKGWKAQGTYGMNGLIGRDADPSADRGWIRGADLLITIEDSSKLVMLFEKEWDGEKYGSSGGPVNRIHKFARFHSGGFHAAFFDGHVEKAKHGEFPIWTKPGFKWGDEDFRMYWIGLAKMRPRPE